MIDGSRRLLAIPSQSSRGWIPVAGVFAATAYLVEMWVDIRLFREPTDDLILLGGAFVKGPTASRALGAMIHLVNGALIASAYAAFARSRLAGPAWARGLAFAVAENTLLWPAVVLLERKHPAFLDGRLPPYSRAIPWLQAWLRHVAFGVTLGALLAPARR